MKKLLSLWISLFIFTTASLVTGGQGITLRQTNGSGIYKKCRKITLTATTRDKKGDSLQIRVLKNNFTELLKKAVPAEDDSLPVFHGSFDDPCSIIVEAVTGDDHTALGFMVTPGKIKQGGKRPEDFDEFWKDEKEKLMALPMDVRTAAVKNYEIPTGYSCVDVEISCTGPKPARGYFAKPAIAAPKSLPAVLLVHAAGVKGSWCRSEPGNAMRYAIKGALCFDLNAHGMLDGQPEAYYARLDTGELKSYFYQGLDSRDDFYFKGMYLRLLRTIDFLAKQPEWDRKRIIVIGESQGGGQALVAAGLDKRVSAAVAIVPAMCDWLGPMVNREGGWPQPLKADVPREEILKTVPYFDAANILKGSKATLFVEIGLIDFTCPPASVYAAINQSRGKKIIYPVPYRSHHQPSNGMAETWENSVYRPRETFINNYLK